MPDPDAPDRAGNGPERMADLLGNPLSEAETALLDGYRRLKGLAARTDLPPCAAANCKHALSYLAQAVTSLGLEFEHLLDIGV